MRYKTRHKRGDIKYKHYKDGLIRFDQTISSYFSWANLCSSAVYNYCSVVQFLKKYVNSKTFGEQFWTIKNITEKCEQLED